MTERSTVQPALPMLFPNLSLAPNDPALVWEPLSEGIEVSWIYYSLHGARSAFLRYAPGARLRQHAHVGYEHILILSGSQRDENGLHEVGAMIVNPPGSVHTVSSDNGCVVLAIWEKPVSFAPVT